MAAPAHFTFYYVANASRSLRLRPTDCELGHCMRTADAGSINDASHCVTLGILNALAASVPCERSEQVGCYGDIGYRQREPAIRNEG